MFSVALGWITSECRCGGVTLLGPRKTTMTRIKPSWKPLMTFHFYMEDSLYSLVSEVVQ